MPARVLIVDNYTKGADVLGRWLRRSDKRVETACDGLQAVETAEQFLPDVMLIELNLPNLSGYEVARKIRGHGWSERTILIGTSGWLTPEERVRAQDAGFDAVLLKPFNHADLSALLASGSGRAELADA